MSGNKEDIIGSKVSTFRVGIFPVPGFALTSYSCTVEPLRAANLLSRRPLYEIIHIGPRTTSKSSGSAVIEDMSSFRDDTKLDMMLVIAGGDPFSFHDRSAFAWLRHQARHGVIVGGVSGGSVILANAGLMAGRRMTVHWEHAELLAERHPDLLVERRLFVIDRDRVTCGGGIAPLDMMHALIADHHGGVFARLVSDWFLHTEIRAATDPQRGGLAERVGAHSPHVLEAISAMESHIADRLSLSQIALVAGVSPRHLNRLFTNALGATVMDHYRDMRLQVARRYVRETAMELRDIAIATGFASASHFSSKYQEFYHVRPNEDRRSNREYS